MGTDDTADDVVRVLDRCHPVSHRFVDCVAKRLRAAFDRTDLCAQKLHAKDIRFLSPNIFAAHVDGAGQTEMGARGGRGNTMLAGAGFGDHACLAHSQRQQCLTDRVVDLVRTGVVEVFSFEPDLGSSDRFG